jgi:hypothetical protein
LGTLRAFFLTLFVIAAAVLIVIGWQGGEPWTAAAFVVFFSSRVARSIIKRPFGGVRDAHPLQHANRFIIVTAAGWLGSGALALVAALTGEGQEWLYVAPCFLVIGALNLYVAARAD